MSWRMEHTFPVLVLVLALCVHLSYQDELQAIEKFANAKNEQHLEEHIVNLLHTYADELGVEDKSQILFHLLNSTLTTSNLKSFKDTFNDTTCYIDTQRILRGSSLWSIEFLDACGKVPPGVLFGDDNWVGSYQQCVRLKAPADNSSVYTNRSFEGKYCSVGLQAELVPNVPLTLGLCLPDSCRAEMVSWLVNQTLGSISIKPGATYCQPKERPLTNLAISGIVVLSVLGALMAVATVCDVILQRRKTSSGISEQQEGSSESDPRDKETEDSAQKTGFVVRLLLCFSVTRNLQTLLSGTSGGTRSGGGRESRDSLDAIHGLRFISMTWVILGHTFVFLVFVSPPRNIAIFGEVLTRWSMQAILSGTLSVDTFFLISGLLVAYLALKEMKQRGGICYVNWVYVYVHRFWRLTVPYALTLFAGTAFMEYTGSGPMWYGNIVMQNCHSSWWSNLLYVNNLVRTSTNETCMGWGWYLANDMQFYWISPLIIVPFFFRWWAGSAVSSVFLLASLITTFFVSLHNKLPAGMQGVIAHPNPNADFNLIYYKPWCRIGPYVIGIMIGYVLFHTNRKLKIRKAVVAVGWVVAYGLAMTVVYGLFGYTKGDYSLSYPVCALFNACNRTVWAIAVGWVILACSTGHGGAVTKILSWQGLVPLSRLTYMAYLVHPFVLLTYYMQMKFPFNYDDMTIICAFLGNLTLSYMVALVASLAFEAPFMALEKVILTAVVDFRAGRNPTYVSIQSDGCRREFHL